MAADAVDEHLLKEFFAEVSEVERDNEVVRVLSCFKLNPFEHLNLPFDSSPDEVKRQYRKVSLMIHPDKCHHPKAKEAFAALAKAQTMLLDPEERGYVEMQCKHAKEELCAEKKKQLKKQQHSHLHKIVNEGKDLIEEWTKTPEFKEAWKKRVREIMTDQEWRRRKMRLRITEEEGRLKKSEEENKETLKRKREDEKKWEDTRENRVSSWRDFQKTGRKTAAGVKPPKLKTEDPTKSYIQRPVNALNNKKK